ncbi:LOW QUALITY PROTEIN: pre-mRNA cleavage complex 2 protein Pcf11 [Lampetra planeri]
MAEDVCEEYKSSLEDLTFNSKPHINMLTILAEENLPFASQIVKIIEAQIAKAPAGERLPVLYLMDSIIKNVAQDYLAFFSHNIVTTFTCTFEKVDENTRKNMFKLRSTWDQILPPKKLHSLDVHVNKIDPAWPIRPPPASANTGSIHVNPKFVTKLPEEPNPPEAAEVMRQQLLAKQKQLLELQQKKLELELEQTKAKLEASLSGNIPGAPRPLVGHRPPSVPVQEIKPQPAAPLSHSQLPTSAGGVPAARHGTATVMVHPGRDPRTNRDPRMNRDPRLQMTQQHHEQQQLALMEDQVSDAKETSPVPAAPSRSSPCRATPSPAPRAEGSSPPEAAAPARPPAGARSSPASKPVDKRHEAPAKAAGKRSDGKDPPFGGERKKEPSSGGDRKKGGDAPDPKKMGDASGKDGRKAPRDSARASAKQRDRSPPPRRSSPSSRRRGRRSPPAWAPGSGRRKTSSPLPASHGGGARHKSPTPPQAGPAGAAAATSAAAAALPRATDKRRASQSPAKAADWPTKRRNLDSPLRATGSDAGAGGSGRRKGGSPGAPSRSRARERGERGERERGEGVRGSRSPMTEGRLPTKRRRSQSPRSPRGLAPAAAAAPGGAGSKKTTPERVPLQANLPARGPHGKAGWAPAARGAGCAPHPRHGPEWRRNNKRGSGGGGGGGGGVVAGGGGARDKPPEVEKEPEYLGSPQFSPEPPPSEPDTPNVGEAPHLHKRFRRSAWEQFKGIRTGQENQPQQQQQRRDSWGAGVSVHRRFPFPRTPTQHHPRPSTDPELHIPKEITQANKHELLRKADMQRESGLITNEQHMQMVHQLNQLFKLRPRGDSGPRPLLSEADMAYYQHKASLKQQGKRPAGVHPMAPHGEQQPCDGPRSLQTPPPPLRSHADGPWHGPHAAESSAFDKRPGKQPVPLPASPGGVSRKPLLMTPTLGRRPPLLGPSPNLRRGGPQPPPPPPVPVAATAAAAPAAAAGGASTAVAAAAAGADEAAVKREGEERGPADEGSRARREQRVELPREGSAGPQGPDPPRVRGGQRGEWGGGPRRVGTPPEHWVPPREVGERRGKFEKLPGPGVEELRARRSRDPSPAVDAPYASPHGRPFDGADGFGQRGGAGGGGFNNNSSSNNKDDDPPGWWRDEPRSPQRDDELPPRRFDGPPHPPGRPDGPVDRFSDGPPERFADGPPLGRFPDRPGSRFDGPQGPVFDGGQRFDGPALDGPNFDGPQGSRFDGPQGGFDGPQGGHRFDGPQGGHRFDGPQGGHRFDGPQGGPRFDGPQGPRFDGPQGPRFDGPQGPRFDGPQGPRFDGPQGPRFDGPQGPRFDGPQGPRFDGPQGPRFDGPQGPRFDGPQGPRFDGPQGMRFDGPQGPRFDGPQGVRFDGPQGPRFDGPQGMRFDGPQGPRFDGPQGVRFDGPQGMRFDGPQGPRFDGPQGMRFEGPQGIRFDGPQGMRFEGPQGPRFDGPQGVRFDGPQVPRFEGPQGVRFEGHRFEGPRMLHFEGPQSHPGPRFDGPSVPRFDGPGGVGAQFGGQQQQRQQQAAFEGPHGGQRFDGGPQFVTQQPGHQTGPFGFPPGSHLQGMAMGPNDHHMGNLGMGISQHGQQLMGMAHVTGPRPHFGPGGGQPFMPASQVQVAMMSQALQHGAMIRGPMQQQHQQQLMQHQHRMSMGLMGSDNHIGQVDVNSLFSKLVASGILQVQTTTTAGTADDARNESNARVTEGAAKKAEEASKEDEEVDEEEEEDDDVDMPDLSGFAIEDLKQRYDGVVQRLYSGIQCYSCGMRFTARQTDVYADHLDWHYRMNRMDKDLSKKVTHRRWYYSLVDWIEFEEIADLEERAKSQFFEQVQEEVVLKTQEATREKEFLSVPAGPAGVEELCEICREQFEQYWDEDEEEWHLKNAVRVDSRTFHPTCYEDHKDSSFDLTPTPTTSTQENPLECALSDARKPGGDDNDDGGGGGAVAADAAAHSASFVACGSQDSALGSSLEISPSDSAPQDAAPSRESRPTGVAVEAGGDAVPAPDGADGGSDRAGERHADAADAAGNAAGTTAGTAASTTAGAAGAAATASSPPPPGGTELSVRPADVQVKMETE